MQTKSPTCRQLLQGTWVYAVLRDKMKALDNIKKWLKGLSFRTGVIVLLCCIPFYILSFAQMLLPISVAAKGVLWTILFGLTILGVEGFQRVKNWLKRRRTDHATDQ